MRFFVGRGFIHAECGTDESVPYDGVIVCALGSPIGGAVVERRLRGLCTSSLSVKTCGFAISPAGRGNFEVVTIQVRRKKTPVQNVRVLRLG